MPGDGRPPTPHQSTDLLTSPLGLVAIQADVGEGEEHRVTRNVPGQAPGLLVVVSDRRVVAGIRQGIGDHERWPVLRACVEEPIVNIEGQCPELREHGIVDGPHRLLSSPRTDASAVSANISRIRGMARRGPAIGS